MIKDKFISQALTKNPKMRFKSRERAAKKDELPY